MIFYQYFEGSAEEYDLILNPNKQELASIMKGIDRINAGLDNLDAKTTEEGAQVQTAVQGLKDEVAELRKQIADGATSEEALNAAADRLDEKILGVESIFTPDASPSDGGTGSVGGTDSGSSEPV